MKIIYLHQYFITRKGASGTRSYEFAKYLVKKGHSVTVVTGYYESSALRKGKGKFFHNHFVDGIRVISVNVHYSSYMTFASRIFSFLKFMIFASWLTVRLAKPDVIYATSTPLTIAVPGLIGSYFRRVPLVFEVRDLWPEIPVELGILRPRFIQILAFWLAKRTYKRSSKIVALSPGIRDGILQYGVDPGKIVLIPNASDIDLFDSANRQAMEVPDFVKVDGQFIVGYFGAMGISNGLEVIIEAARLLQTNATEDVVFLLIGKGPKKAGLTLLAQKSNLQNVLFLDPKPRSEIPNYVYLMDVCMVIFANYPTLQTNSPNKLFDALAAGKPIITNKAGWMHELVTDYHIGLSIPDCSAEQLAEGILNLKNAPVELLHMGENSRKLAIIKFERISLAKKMETTLYQCVQERYR